MSASPRCRTRSAASTGSSRPCAPSSTPPAPGSPRCGQRLLGLQSAQLLAARAEAYASAEAELPAARKALTEAIAERSDTRGEIDRLAEKLNGIQIELDRRTRELKAIDLRLADIAREHGPRRHAQAERILKLLRRRRGMPAHWLDANELALLADKYGYARGARLQLERLRRHLDEGCQLLCPLPPAGVGASPLLVSVPVPQPVPSHSPDAAKATFSNIPERVMTLPVHTPARKDPKLANNWKNKTADQLTDEEVLSMPDAEY